MRTLQLAGLQGSGDIVPVHNLATGGVHDVRAGLHHVKQPLVEHALRLLHHPAQLLNRPALQKKICWSCPSSRSLCLLHTQHSCSTNQHYKEILDMPQLQIKFRLSETYREPRGSYSSFKTPSHSGGQARTCPACFVVQQAITTISWCPKNMSSRIRRRLQWG